MIISLKDLKDQCDKNDTNWLHSKSTITRIKNILKSDKLPKDVVTFLWQERTLRWDLVRRQTLPNSLVFFIIDNYNNTREISKSIYEETLQNQKIEELHVKYIDAKFFSDTNMKQYLNTWRIIPGKMIEFSEINFFFFLIKQYPQITNDEDYMKALVEIIRFDNSQFISLISYLEENGLLKMLEKNYSGMLMTLCASVYFRDEVVLKLLSSLTEETIKHISPKLVSRNNCSAASKAMLLLFN